MANKVNDGPFLSDGEWETNRISGEFNFVIIGSSFCALGFIHQALKNNPNAKILIIERGSHEEFHQLSPLDLSKKSKKEEKCDWELSKKTEKGKWIRGVRGMNNFFGGRSSFWKAWSPKPTREEMFGWPDKVIQRVQEYFPCAQELLNVIPVNKIKTKQGKELFGELQKNLHEVLQIALVQSEIQHITRVEHAPIAVKSEPKDDAHQKFSAVKPLLDILETRPNIKVVINCEVQKILQLSGKATALDTTKGTVTLGDASLVLAMSTLPSTTLMLNSFQPFSKDNPLQKIGERFTGHFVSYITARVPFDQSKMYHFLQHQTQDQLEMAALYVAGRHPESKHQFHVQLTAVAVTDPPPEQKLYDHMRHLLKAPSQQQLSSSTNHIVFVCATLGQLDHQNEDNWYQVDSKTVGTDRPHKATLQVVTNQSDNALWDLMDETTFDILEQSLTPASNIIEYWHNASNGGGSWNKQRPPAKQIRTEGLVHPASTMWIGDSRGISCPVKDNYQFNGFDNIFLTGGALWPTGASWNPTCAMTAMAMNLADLITCTSKTASSSTCKSRL